MTKKNVKFLPVNHKFFLFSLLFVFSFKVSALDFGGLLTNNSSLKNRGNKDFKLDQKNSASFWLRAPFDMSGEIYFASEVIYDFESDSDAEQRTNALDFNLFELAFSKNMDSSKIGLNMGRFYFSDFTGIIFTQNSDGLRFSFQNDWLNISVYGSYTGLLNAQNVDIVTTAPKLFVADGKTPWEENRNLCFKVDNDKIYDFAEKYAVADFSLSFPYLFANQTVSLEFLGTFRLENDSFNRMYATFALDGPIYQTLFYNVSSTVGFVEYDGETEISNLSKIGFEYFFKKLSFGLNALYSSGEQGGLSSFEGFTKNTSTYSARDFLYSGIVKAGANLSYKPFDVLVLNLASDVIFNAVSGDKNDGIEYFGFQYSVDALWQIKSDFQIGFTASQFMDKDNLDDVKKTSFSLKAALAF